MAQRELVSDDLWEAIEPLLPRRPRQPRGGRPWVSDRAALGGIIFVLQTGIPWKRLPTELGYGSGITCWRRVRDWQAAGVWGAPASGDLELAGGRGSDQLGAGQPRQHQRPREKIAHRPTAHPGG